MTKTTSENLPTVSVVTPSFNQASFIEDTIKSVISQEGDFYLDYIIIDGGSSDESVDIIRKYDQTLKDGGWEIKCSGITFRWASEKDNGQADAIMKGFRTATGEILAWLNSDDTYLPGTLLKTVNTFVREPHVSVLYGSTYFSDAKGVLIGKYPTEPFNYRRLAIFNFICQPSTFFRKSVLTEVGGLDMSLHFVMDYDLWIRLAGKYCFKYLPEFLSTYRLHEESKTISPSVVLANHKEALDTVSRHYGWFPLNRVYIYCHQFLKSKMPAALVKYNFLMIFMSLPFAMMRYVRLNRGIRLEDMKTINPSNIRKLFMDRMDIYRDY